MSRRRRHRRKVNKTPWIIGGLSAVVVAAATGLWMTRDRWNAPSEQELMASAQKSIAQNKPDAARVQIKALLQANPQSAQGRYMLGKMLHDSGDMISAEAELRRALEVGHPEAEALPLLAHTLVSLKKGATLVLQFGQHDIADAKADAELKTHLAAAALQDGNPAAADGFLNRALARVPHFAPALLARARMLALDKPEQALAEADQLLAQHPQMAEAWLLKGELLQRSQPAQTSAMVEALQTALKFQADLVGAHATLIGHHLAKMDVPAATAQFTAMKKAAPDHPQTVFFEALLADQRGDLAKARELTQLLVRGAPDNLRVLLLAGQVEFRLNALVQAEAHFAKALQAYPQSLLARRQLGSTHLRAGQAEKAITVLKPLVDADPPDVEAITLTAQAQLLQGDAKGADQNFTRAARLKPGDTQLRTAVAVSQLAKGQDNAGLAELQAVAATDKGTAADMALISARVQRKDLAGALKAVEGLAAKVPDQPLPHHLRGTLALHGADRAAARQHYEAALAKDADYLPSMAALAQLDIQDKQPAAAKARFEGMLKRHPGNSAALMALAELSQLTGGPLDERVQWLEQAIKSAPTDLFPRLILADLQLNNRQIKAALGTIQGGLAALPDNAELLDRLGRTQLMAGDTQQAISAFNKLVAVNPKAALPHLRLADAHQAANNGTAVAAEIRRAAEISPQSPAVQQALVRLAMQEGKPAQALAVARAAQSQRPTEAQGFAMEGEIEAASRHYDAAAVAFRKAIALKNPGDALLRLHATLVAAGKAADADKLAADWRKSHPDDLGLTLHLGDMALAAGKLDEAEGHYREVLAKDASQVLANNNLAFVLARQKKPGAVPFAEKALQGAPGTPALLDTLAFALAAEGQLPKAVSVQSQAVAAAPMLHQYRLQLARLQLQAGDKVNAKLELTKLSKLGSSYAKQAEVAELIKQASN